METREMTTPAEASAEGAALAARAAAIRDEILAAGSGDIHSPATPGNIRTCVRVRPTLAHEQQRCGERIPGMSAASFAQFEYESVVVDRRSREICVLSEVRLIGEPTGDLAVERFAADDAFGGGDNDDAAVFDRAVCPLVETVLKGSQAALIAFGQTGAGKTHTSVAMQRRAAAALLSHRAIASLEVSFLEICGDALSDLLVLADEEDAAASRPPLSLRENANGQLVVTGLRRIAVTTVEEADKVLADANRLRAAAPTSANERSSRSHAICTLRPLRAAASENSGVDEEEEASSLVIVDLAGSERREDVLGHDRQRMQETAATNTSLSSLKECVRLQRLAQRGGGSSSSSAAVVVPYRRSKLTRLLRPFLEGSTPCVILAHLSPLRSAGKHTASTLEFISSLNGESRQKKERLAFNSVEQWTAEEVMGWVRGLDGGKYSHLAICFGGFTGKLLAVEWLGHLVKRIRAEGGEEADAHAIYEAFHELHSAAKRDQQSKDKPITKKATSGGGKASSSGLAAARRAARAAAAAGSTSEVEIFEGPPRTVAAPSSSSEAVEVSDAAPPVEEEPITLTSLLENVDLSERILIFVPPQTLAKAICKLFTAAAALSLSRDEYWRHWLQISLDPSWPIYSANHLGLDTRVVLLLGWQLWSAKGSREQLCLQTASYDTLDRTVQHERLQCPLGRVTSSFLRCRVDQT